MYYYGIIYTVITNQNRDTGENKMTTNFHYQVIFKYSEKRNRILSHTMYRSDDQLANDWYENELGDGIHYIGTQPLPMSIEIKIAEICQLWANIQDPTAYPDSDTINKASRVTEIVNDARTFLNKRDGYRE
jgi:hypothetical protein